MSEQAASGALRRGSAADIFRLQEIERDAATLFRGWPGIDTSALTSVTALSDHLHAVAQGLSMVMDVDGKLAGFAIGDMQGEDAYLRELDVALAHQQRGYGARLVDAFVAAARAKRARHIYLATFRTPPWNAPFYARMGFREVAHADYLPWMTDLEASQAAFLDLSTRVFMRLD
jgi:GNAT superfamily N-acetyltransferase